MPDKTGNNRLNNGQFAKGHSGNPKGRPKGSMSIPDMLKRIGEEDIPADLRERVEKIFNEAELGQITMLEAVMRTTMMYAIQGKSWAVQFIADRLEGKPRQTIELEQHEPIQLIKTGIDNFDNG